MANGKRTESLSRVQPVYLFPNPPAPVYLVPAISGRIKEREWEDMNREPEPDQI
jgi:hypothetical protein